MLTIYYGNIHDNRARYRSFAVYPPMFEKIKAACKGHFGFGGENKDSYYVDASEWDKCLELINSHIKKHGTGSFIYRQQVNAIS